MFEDAEALDAMEEGFDCGMAEGNQSYEPPETGDDLPQPEDLLDEADMGEDLLLLDMGGFEAPVPASQLVSQLAGMSGQSGEAFQSLLERFPALEESPVPEEVLEALFQGADPVVAFQDYLLSQYQFQEQLERQRESAWSKQTGSAIGSGGADDYDSAFAAFDAVFQNF